MKKVYFANDLFNDANLEYNRMVVENLREECENLEVYLPQENDAINDKKSYADSEAIAKADMGELMDSDLLVAVIDSDDSGVALEIGAFYHTEKPIIGIFTDTRRVAFENQKKRDALDEIGENQVAYTNLMVVGIIKDRGALVGNHEEAVRLIKNHLNEESFNEEE